MIIFNISKLIFPTSNYYTVFFSSTIQVLDQAKSRLQLQILKFLLVLV